METSPAPKLCKILSESRQIIKAQRRNLFALSFLFLVPASITTLLYPTLAYFLFNGTNNQSVLDTPTKNLILALGYVLLNSCFSLCAVGSITYTAFHALSGETVKLKSAIKSISSSFFPLLGTNLIVSTTVFVIALILSFLFFSTIFGAVLLFGFRFDKILISSSYSFAGLYVVVLVVVELVVIYLLVNWALASVVVVVESAWGFKALKRSRSLIKVKKGLALSLYLVFGIAYAILVWSNKYYSTASLGADHLGTGDEMIKYLPLILALRVLITLGFLTLVQLYSTTATTVLYAYCKAIDDDRKQFVGEYVSLPFNEYEKVAVV